MKLGFVDPPVALRIYANRSNPPHLWYTIWDKEVVELPTTALCGYLTDVRLEEKERRGKSVPKLEIYIQGDRQYVIETGFESLVSKGFLSAIATMSPADLKSPITVMVSPGDDDKVLFCRVYDSDNKPIRSEYGDDSDVGQLLLAVQNLLAASKAVDLFSEYLDKAVDVEMCNKLRAWVGRQPLPPAQRSEMCRRITEAEQNLKVEAVA